MARNLKTGQSFLSNFALAMRPLSLSYAKGTVLVSSFAFFVQRVCVGFQLLFLRELRCLRIALNNTTHPDVNRCFERRESRLLQAGYILIGFVLPIHFFL